MKADVQYEFHHFGIPLQERDTAGKFSVKAGMYTTDNPGKFRVQWHRLTDDSPLYPLLKTVPHVAFKVIVLLMRYPAIWSGIAMAGFLKSYF